MSGGGKVSQVAIERALVDAPAIGQEEIARRLGVTRHAVRRAQAALVAREEIRVLGVGKGAFRSKVAPPAKKRTTLERARASLPKDGSPYDVRRELLALALVGLEQWPTVHAAVAVRGVPLLEAVWPAAEAAGPDSRHASSLIVAGAFALPTELAAAVVYACGHEVALELLAEASRIVAADPDRSADDQAAHATAAPAPAASLGGRS